jgi:signal transduction histidine kinase
MGRLVPSAFDVFSAGADALNSGRGGGSLTGRSRLLPKALWAGIILVVAGCLALVGLNVYQMVYVAPALAEGRNLIVHAYSVISTAHGIERNLREAESSERGYIITGEQRYLDDAYGNGMKAAPELLNQLERLSTAIPEQHQRVVQIAAEVNRRVALLNQTLNLTQHGGLDSARRLMDTEVGLNTMHNVAAQLDAIVESENGRLQTRLQQLAADQDQIRLVAEGGVGLTLVIMFVGGLLILFALRDRERSRADLEETRSTLAQAQKMQTLGELAGGIAHDFNNMLAVVSGGTRLLRRRVSQTDPELTSLLEGIDQGVTRATGLTSRLLAFSRRRPIMQQVIDTNAVVGGMADILRYAMGRGIESQTALAPECPPVLCDPNQLENAVLNLVVNARDAMPEGGRIVIETAKRSGDGQIAAAHAAISVQDTGRGMSADVVRHAFEPFFTTKGEKGTGLGLAQVHSLARQAGGYVAIDSAPGKGTTVTIHLPAATHA